MSLYQELERTVLQSGLWNGGRRTHNHGFVLSPCVYEMSGLLCAELSLLAVTLYECLSGLGRILAIASLPHLSHGPVWAMFSRVLRTGVPKEFRDIQTLHPGRVPSIFKVDFLESVDGRLLIVEIDGYNKRGLGYALLVEQMRRVIAPTANVLPGVVPAIAKEVSRRGRDNLVLLYADQERFYDPTFRILAEGLSQAGVPSFVLSEQNFARIFDADAGLLRRDPLVGGNREIQNPLFLDLPFLYKSRGLGQRLAELYAQGEVDFLICPKPFTSSKAVLALLRNDEDDWELEAILRAHIPGSSLERVRRYIPQTYLVHNGEPLQYWKTLSDSRSFVLKESMSSGMKGTFFSGGADFDAALQRAAGSHYHSVLQEEVTLLPRTYEYFTDEGEVLTDTWYNRLTAHFSSRELADLSITSRRDKRVHGAVDAIELGSVIVP
ncbi:MAG: hypothetical protein Q8P01_03765 [bacterium]|nr:hypothetical protein [bacterium]